VVAIVKKIRAAEKRGLRKELMLLETIGGDADHVGIVVAQRCISRCSKRW
jgi:hypothetical protein